MKFFRQLAAVLVVVAAVVVLGVAWEHSSEAGWIGAPRAGIKVAAAPAGTAVQAGAGRVVAVAPEDGAGFDASDVRNLARTAEIEAAVMAAVVVLDAVRRRRRRAGTRGAGRTWKGRPSRR